MDLFGIYILCVPPGNLPRKNATVKFCTTETSKHLSAITTARYLESSNDGSIGWPRMSVVHYQISLLRCSVAFGTMGIRTLTSRTDEHMCYSL